MSLIAELKRRNVFRVAIAYVVLAWLIMQVGDTMAPALRLPETVNSVLAFFLILGFPIAIFFAWAFEMTPEGLKLEKDVDRETSITPQTGRKLDRSIIVLLVVALGYFVWQSGRTPDVVMPQEAGGLESIAVLPFENMSSDPEQEYFSDGLTEELLNLLAKIPELRVSSRTSAFFYKGKDIKITDVGRELGVEHVLEGSVRKSGTKIRITAQLIRVDDDSHLWSDTWDRELDDVFEIQDDIARKVVDELHVRLLGSMPASEAADADAYALYLQARHLSYQRTHDALRRAESLAKQAIELDPDYIPIHVFLAHIYSQMGDIGTKVPDEAFPLARAAIDKALQLDPDYGKARALLADYYMAYEHDFRAAKAELDAALAADPYDVDTLYHASFLETATGNPQKGIDFGEKALERDPLFTPAVVVTGFAYEVAGDLDSAELHMRRNLELNPGASGSYYYLANVLLFSGRFEEALEVAEQESLLGFRHTVVSAIHHSMGNKEASDAALRELLTQEEAGWDYQHAQLRAWRGEIDEAFAAYERALEKNDAGAQLILGDPYLENLRSDPRYDEFVERVGLRLN